MKMISCKEFADSGSKKFRRLKIVHPKTYDLNIKYHLSGTGRGWTTNHLLTAAEIAQFFGKPIKDGTYIKRGHAACAELSDGSLVVVALRDLCDTYTGWGMQIDDAIRNALKRGKRP